MPSLNFHPAGRHYLQIPGPSPVPDRILRAISLPTIDHRGPEFGALGRQVLAGLGTIFKTRHPVVIYPASGTGAWEAALVNTLSPADTNGTTLRQAPFQSMTWRGVGLMAWAANAKGLSAIRRGGSIVSHWQGSLISAEAAAWLF